MEDGGGGPSLALRLQKRANLLRNILSFHKTNPKDYMELRSSSKYFHRALRPPPLWTSLPHPTYITLQSLLDRLEKLYSKDKSQVLPKIYIEEGEHCGGEVTVNIPTSIIGAGRGKTILLFGLKIAGNKSDGIVEIEDLTIKGGELCGLYASVEHLNKYQGGGMNVIMRGISVEDFQQCGVMAYKADVSCDDLQVVGCGRNGVRADYKATITLSGQGTSIQRNYYSKTFYGLHANSSSTIHLVHPLTREQIWMYSMEIGRSFYYTCTVWGGED